MVSFEITFSENPVERSLEITDNDLPWINFYIRETLSIRVHFKLINSEYDFSFNDLYSFTDFIILNENDKENLKNGSIKFDELQKRYEQKISINSSKIRNSLCDKIHSKLNNDFFAEELNDKHNVISTKLDMVDVYKWMYIIYCYSI